MKLQWLPFVALLVLGCRYEPEDQVAKTLDYADSKLMAVASRAEQRFRELEQTLDHVALVRKYGDKLEGSVWTEAGQTGTVYFAMVTLSKIRLDRAEAATPESKNATIDAWLLASRQTWTKYAEEMQSPQRMATTRALGITDNLRSAALVYYKEVSTALDEIRAEHLRLRTARGVQAPGCGTWILLGLGAGVFLLVFQGAQGRGGQGRSPSPSMSKNTSQPVTDAILAETFRVPIQSAVETAGLIDQMIEDGKFGAAKTALENGLAFVRKALADCAQAQFRDKTLQERLWDDLQTLAEQYEYHIRLVQRRLEDEAKRQRPERGESPAGSQEEMSYPEEVVRALYRFELGPEDLPTLTKAALEAKYRALMRVLHPDLAGADPERQAAFTAMTQRINQAREILLQAIPG